MQPKDHVLLPINDQGRCTAEAVGGLPTIMACLQDLHAAMEAHLRLHFNNAESSDENVLNIYPTPLRKRILRFLYLKKLEECYLFKGCKPKLLDALLGSATVHLFMPRVQLVMTHPDLESSAAGGLAGICHCPALCPRSGNHFMLGQEMLGGQ